MNRASNFNCDDIPFGDELPVVANAKKALVGLTPFNAIKPVNLKTMFSTEPPPLDMVLHGLLIGTIGPMVSPGASGKSMFTIQAALQIATGRDTLGMGDVKKGRVVIFAGEDPTNALHHRLFSMCKEFSFTQTEQNDAEQNLRIIPTIGTNIDILNPVTMEWIRELTRGARLIIFDTLTRYHSLDENKAEDAKKIMAALEQLAHSQNSAIIFPHHVSKASVNGGMAELQQAARGSSVFVDNARWASFMAKMSSEDAKLCKVLEVYDYHNKYVKWNVNKQNYSVPISDIWLERKKGGVLVPANFNSERQYADASQSPKNNGGGNVWIKNRK